MRHRLLAQCILWALLLAGTRAAPGKVCPVSAYSPAQGVQGAPVSGRQETYSTAAIQAALDDCSDGGTAVLDSPGGSYLSASLTLSGSVHLHIPSGVTLLAGTRREDYGATQPDWYLLRLNCTGCLVYGGGTVDGQARRWVVGRWPQQKVVLNFNDSSCELPLECRPRLVGVVDSEDVRISGLTLVDPIYWTLHIVRSRGVRVEGVRILGDFQIFNTDGIDIDSSEDVEVAGVDVRTADDAICIKTSQPGRPAARIVVRDSTLRSRASAVKLGSQSVADMSDLVFRNLTVLDSHRGLAIQLRDGGSVRGVVFEGISVEARHFVNSSWWWGAGEPIYVTALPRFAGGQVGTVSNVTFSGIHARSENGVFIAGRLVLGGAPTVSGLRLQGIHLDLVRRTDVEGGFQDYRPTEDGAGVVASGGTAALWVEGAEGVDVSGLQVTYTAPRRPDWKQGFQIDPQSVRIITLQAALHAEQGAAAA